MAATSSALDDRQRIERNLHDGAQARLVSLATDLGRARDRLEGGATTEDAAAIVAEAHEQAKQALVEVRQLARGIHPAILTDRGLDAALSALAAQSPIPTALDVSIGRRLPAAVEANAYYIVAEAITNAAKHSGATQIRVRAHDQGEALVLRIADNGAGGAVAQPGGGLAGIGQRVKSLGGSCVIDSPRGGPTDLAISLPCV